MNTHPKQHHLCGAILCAVVLTTLGRADSQAASAFEDGVTSPPVLTHFVQAQYPEEARRAGFHGFCIVRLTVDEHGIPRNVHMSRLVGMGLDESAIKAVKDERFKPAMRGGHPVAFPLSMQVSFKSAP
jgi:TonB family protein